LGDFKQQHEARVSRFLGSAASIPDSESARALLAETVLFGYSRKGGRRIVSNTKLWKNRTLFQKT
jgi:hypothetical protein